LFVLLVLVLVLACLVVGSLLLGVGWSLVMPLSTVARCIQRTALVRMVRLVSVRHLASGGGAVGSACKFVIPRRRVLSSTSSLPSATLVVAAPRYIAPCTRLGSSQTPSDASGASEEMWLQKWRAGHIKESYMALSSLINDTRYEQHFVALQTRETDGESERERERERERLTNRQTDRD
jgi:hypothetical protein